jgi:hypothetical protein
VFSRTAHQTAQILGNVGFDLLSTFNAIVAAFALAFLDAVDVLLTIGYDLLDLIAAGIPV